jgi:hypothetical protein
MSISADWGACGAVLPPRPERLVRPWARLVEAPASPSGTRKSDAEIALMTRPPLRPRQSGTRDRQNR